MKVCIISSSEDKSIVEDFKMYATMLRRQGLLEIVEQDKSTIVIFFISPHLILDTFCQQALSVAEYKKQKIIPIIISSCDWEKDTFLGKFQHLPRNGYLCNDSNGDLWMEVVSEIRSILEHSKPETVRNTNDLLGSRVWSISNP